METIEQKLGAGRRCITAYQADGFAAARAAQAAGADLIVLYFTAALGLDPVAGLLPYGNANDIVCAMAAKLDCRRLDIPVYAGACGSEPLRRRGELLDGLRRMGVSGVQNFPTIGMADGTFRCNMEAVRFGYNEEVAFIRCALESGMPVLPYVFNQSEALQMAFAGAETLIFHLGYPGVRKESRLELTVQNYVERIRVFETVVRQNHPNVRLLVYSPSAPVMAAIEPALRERTGVDGVFRLESAVRGEGMERRA